jgi:hypothetical protein
MTVMAMPLESIAPFVQPFSSVFASNDALQESSHISSDVPIHAPRALRHANLLASLSPAPAPERSPNDQPSTLADSPPLIVPSSRIMHFGRASLQSALAGYRPQIRFLNPIDDLTKDWSSDELAAGRRIVRFKSLLIGSEVHISASAVSQAAYDSPNIGHEPTNIFYMSCIDYPGTGRCVFTSVDIICLLESIEGRTFGVMEKNRIRRNVEVFHPVTIAGVRARPTSATKGDLTSTLFQRVIDFPNPRPRNMEKDIKVFDWLCLRQAVEKIMKKEVSILISALPND